MTYVEEEAAIDHLARLFRGWIWQVELQLFVGDAGFVEGHCVELLVAGDVDRCQIAVGDQALPAAECIAHELHGAFIVGWQV